MNSKRKKRYFRGSAKKRATIEAKNRKLNADELKSKYTPTMIQRFEPVRNASSGQGGAERIYFKLSKKSLNVEKGNIIKHENYYYIVSRIAMGCSAVKTATVYCEPYDVKAIKGKKILRPKKL